MRSTDQSDTIPAIHPLPLRSFEHAICNPDHPAAIRLESRDPVNLLAHVRALSHAELEALIAGRPDVLQLAERIRPRLGDLVSTLGSESSIHQALAGLDRFHRQMLDLAAASNGRVDRRTAETQGVAPEALAEAARTFSSLALATPENGSVRLFGPVLDVVARSNPLGLNLPGLLEQETKYQLQARARALAISAAGSKADLIAHVVSHLSDRRFLTALMGGAPSDARVALDIIRERGGRADQYELAAGLGQPVGGYRRRYYSRSARVAGLTWLEARGLVFTHQWTHDALVPAQVELALRDRAYPTLAAKPPPVELADPTFDRGPLNIVEELSKLLGALAQAEVPLLKSGDIGARERRRLALELGLPEDRIANLIRMAGWTELLTVRTEARAPTRRGRHWAPPAEDSYLTISREGRRYLETGPAAAWLMLFRGYLRTACGQVWVEGRSATLKPLLAAIEALPAGRGISCEALGRRLAWLHPGTWSSDESATTTAISAASWLWLLGAGSAPPVLGLSPLGRAALAGAEVEEVEARLPTTVEECTVQAALPVIVPGPPSAALGSGLARFTDLKSQSSARLYRLTSVSLRRALDRGMTASEIECFLEQRSTAELPSTVREMIRDVGRRHGRLRVGRAAFYIVGDDEATVAEMVASRKLRSLQLRQIAPTVAIAEASSEKAVVEALRKAGLMPAADQPATSSLPVTARPGASSRKKDLVPPMPAFKEAQVASEEVKALARKLLNVDVQDDEGQDDESGILHLFASRSRR